MPGITAPGGVPVGRAKAQATRCLVRNAELPQRMGQSPGRLCGCTNTLILTASLQ